MKKRISAISDDRGELSLESDPRIKIWLVWSIAEYANGFPMVDLRAVATSVKQAEKYKQLLIDDFLDDKRELKSLNLKQNIRIEIEERVTNHCYGLSMSLLKYITKG